MNSSGSTVPRNFATAVTRVETCHASLNCCCTARPDANRLCFPCPDADSPRRHGSLHDAATFHRPCRLSHHHPTAEVLRPSSQCRWVLGCWPSCRARPLRCIYVWDRYYPPIKDYCVNYLLAKRASYSAFLETEKSGSSVITFCFVSSTLLSASSGVVAILALMLCYWDR